MEYQDILVETQGEIGLITMNSPKTINALSQNMVGEMISALEAFGSEDSIKVLIVRANGKHFCSGHNLREMVGPGAAESRFIFDRCTKMMSLIHHIPQIVIAQVHGIATAAGCQLTAQCDLAVADETARFATPGVKIGLFCTTPMVALSRAVGSKMALEMLLTGRMISADEALACGLINKVVPASDLSNVTLELARSIAEASAFTLATGKRAFYEQIGLDEPRAYEYAANVMSINLLAEDAQEGIKAFLEKRKPVWQGR